MRDRESRTVSPRHDAAVPRYFSIRLHTSLIPHGFPASEGLRVAVTATGDTNIIGEGAERKNQVTDLMGMTLVSDVGFVRSSIRNDAIAEGSRTTPIFSNFTHAYVYIKAPRVVLHRLHHLLLPSTYYSTSTNPLLQVIDTSSYQITSINRQLCLES